MIEGLYVTISPDGTIKKHLSTKNGEVPFPDRSIAEEVIALSSRDYIFLIIHRKNLFCLINGPDSDSKVIAEVATVCEKIKRKKIICGTLAQFEFLDRYHYWTSPKTPGISKLVDVTLNFGRAANAWADACHTLKQLSENSLAEAHDITATYFTVMQYGGTATYIFRSEEQYIYFLLQHLLESKTRICKCQFCGRYFTPRTKHKTLYCDRIVRNGKTCKEIAPYLKRKERIAASRVLSQFEHSKDMMFHRFDRTGDDKESSIVDITYDQYTDWLSSATKARDRYLAGELTEEEAMAIIYVPKKDEMLENNSSEYTLANSCTQS
mgnify:CR=1 FL=1